MSSANLTLIILLIMAAFFLSKRIPNYITALCGALLLAAIGILPAKFLFTGFSHPILILFAGMFVIGDSMFRTGLANQIGEWMVRRTGHHERKLLWGTMAAAGLLSTIASNTGTTAALIPVVMGICSAAGIPASKQLMPMAFATGFGGFSTLIGTPPNIIVSEALANSGLTAFTFFEFAWIGVPLALAGMVYMDFARRWLPDSGMLAKVEVEKDGPSSSNMPARSKSRMWICAAILLGVIVFMAVGVSGVPLEAVAVTGAILCVLTGCITGEDAIKSIEWETVILFGSMFAVAQAMESSGASEMISGSLLAITGANPNAYVVVAVPMIFTILLATILSNTACAVLMAPIGLTFAKTIGANPQAVMMAIAVAASCSFLTPLGTPPNMLVWKPGHYSFMDYLKVGAGLTVVCLIVGVLIIPWKWPVFP